MGSGGSNALTPYGARSVSRIHAEERDLGVVPGIGRALIEYVPGESTSGLFGGNSNWRGPIWMPINYSVVQAIEKIPPGDDVKVPVPCLGVRQLTLKETANLIADRLVELYRPNDGRRPALATQPPFATSPHWQGLLLFYEYFHADTGSGLGAAHQTGWTRLLANLIMRRYRKDIPEFWSRRSATPRDAAQGRSELRVA